MTQKIKTRHTVLVHLDKDKASRIAQFATINPLYEIAVTIKNNDEVLCKTQFQAWAEDHAEMTKRAILLISNALK